MYVGTFSQTEPDDVGIREGLIVGAAYHYASFFEINSVHISLIMAIFARYVPACVKPLQI